MFPVYLLVAVVMELTILRGKGIDSVHCCKVIQAVGLNDFRELLKFLLGVNVYTNDGVNVCVS